MATVTEGLSRTMAGLPEHLRKSLTWERGMELADHRTVTINTGQHRTCRLLRRPAEPTAARNE